MLNIKEADTCVKIDRIYTAFNAKRTPDFSFPGESHDFWELVYVIDGCAGIMADSNIYELKKGNIIFHKPFEFHRIWSVGENGTAYMVISFDISGTDVAEFENAMFQVSQDEQFLLTSLIKQIDNNYSEAPDEISCYGNDAVSFSRFVFTLDLLLTECFGRLSPAKALESENTVIFNRVVKYMKNNLSKNPSNEELAEYINVSSSTLKRVFREYTGLGVHQYFVQLKISEAKKLLRGGFTVFETSEALGFANQNYFSASFKKMTGVSPSYYKKIIVEKTVKR